jgi:hypothetical protein
LGYVGFALVDGLFEGGDRVLGSDQVPGAGEGFDFAGEFLNGRGGEVRGGAFEGVGGAADGGGVIGTDGVGESGDVLGPGGFATFEEAFEEVGTAKAAFEEVVVADGGFGVGSG